MADASRVLRASRTGGCYSLALHRSCLRTAAASVAEGGPVDDGADPDPSRLLEGVRVLDFTQYLAGPSCTRLLVELGADVIKFEVPPDGDPTRAMNPQRAGVSGVFIQQNRGKRSVCLDLRRADVVEAVKQLLPTVDVVVENGTPGVM